MIRSPTILLAARAPTPFYFSSADEEKFLRTGAINCTGTQAPSRLRLPTRPRVPRVVRNPETGRHHVVAAMNG